MLVPNRTLQTLNIITILMLLANTALIFLYAPRERIMGEVQRIFYFHVGVAWVGMAAFVVALIAGVIYLRSGDLRWDRLGAASVEIGLLFAFMTIVSGSVWARPAWNTWWTWDPRLTTYTIMVLIYIAYLMLRQGIDEPGRRARFAAVYAIVGFISVPITFFAIRIWRTIHPAVIGTGAETAQGGFDMTSPMVIVLLFSIATLSVLYVCLMANRLQLEKLAERVEHLKARVLSA